MQEQYMFCVVFQDEVIAVERQKNQEEVMTIGGKKSGGDDCRENVFFRR